MDELLYNFKNNIINYSKYNNEMNLLELFLNNLNSLPKPFSIKLCNMKINISNSLHNLRVDLFKFVNRSGSLSIKYIILLLFNENYKTIKGSDNKLLKYLKFYNYTFKVLSLDVYPFNLENSSVYRKNYVDIDFKIDETNSKKYKLYKSDIQNFYQQMLLLLLK